MIRFAPFALVVLFAAAAGWLSLAVDPWWWLAAVPLLALAVLGVADLAQRRHSVLRNYPITGHLRFLLESIRPRSACTTPRGCTPGCCAAG